MQDRVTPTIIQIKNADVKSDNSHIVVLSGHVIGLTYNGFGETIVEVKTNINDVRSIHPSNISAYKEWEDFFEKYRYYYYQRNDYKYIDVSHFGNHLFFPPNVKIINSVVDVSSWKEPYFWKV